MGKVPLPQPGMTTTHHRPHYVVREEGILIMVKAAQPLPLLSSLPPPYLQCDSSLSEEVPRTCPFYTHQRRARAAEPRPHCAPFSDRLRASCHLLRHTFFFASARRRLTTAQGRGQRRPLARQWSPFPLGAVLPWKPHWVRGGAWLGVAQQAEKEGRQWRCSDVISIEKGKAWLLQVC